MLAHDTVSFRTYFLFAAGLALLAPMSAHAQGKALRAGPDGTLAGVVKERLEGGGYTYLRLEAAGASAWAAVPTTSKKVGDSVVINTQALMERFESKSLHRSFDEIYFGTLGSGPGAPPPGLQRTSSSAAPAAMPAWPAPPPSRGKAAGLRGTVREILQVPGYSYLRLSTAGGEVWAAVGTAQVSIGAEVEVLGASVMDGFESKSLKRKFDRIVFGTLAAK